MVQVSCSLALFCIPRHQRCRASCRTVFSSSATPRDKAVHAVKSPLASKGLSMPRLEPVSPTWPQISQQRSNMLFKAILSDLYLCDCKSKHTMTLLYIVDQHLNQIIPHHPDYMWSCNCINTTTFHTS